MLSQLLYHKVSMQRIQEKEEKGRSTEKTEGLYFQMPWSGAMRGVLSYITEGSKEDGMKITV